MHDIKYSGATFGGGVLDDIISGIKNIFKKLRDVFSRFLP